MINTRVINMKNLTDNQLIAGLAALCLVTYCRIFDVPFVFDDYAYIKDNPFIRDFENFFHRQSALKTFAANPHVITDTLNSFLTRPLSYLTFSINYHVHGVTVAGYHLVNILIHTLNVITVYLLIRVTARLFLENNPCPADEAIIQDTRKTAFITAALFAVHPLMTNSVTYIIHRMTSLVALFYLTSILLYACHRGCRLKSIKTALYCLSLAFCCAAMLTKESAFTLPLMIFLYELFILSGHLKQRLIRLIPFFAAMTIVPYNVIMLQYSEKSQAGGLLASSLNVVNFSHVSSWEYLLTQFRAVAYYLKLLLLPLRLSLEHDFRVSHSLADVDVLLSLALHLSLIGYGCYLMRTSKNRGKHALVDGLAGFGIIWFYIALMVESSIIPMDVMAVEYRTYLPSFGFFLFMVCLVNKIFDKFFVKGTGLNPDYLLWIPVICLMMCLTVMKNEVWRKPDELWKQTILLYPKLDKPYSNLAEYYVRKGELTDAINVYKLSFKEIQYKPGLHYELGNIYILSKEYELAIAEMVQAIIMKPDMKEAYDGLIKACIFTGRYEQANEAFNTANSLKYVRH